MKQFIHILLAACMLTGLTACDPDDGGNDGPVICTYVTTAAYIVNRGQYYNQVDGTITLANLSTGATAQNFFRTANDRSIGASPNSATVYGDRLFVAVTESNTIEVCDLNGKSIRQIRLSEIKGMGSSPREIVCHEGKAYISMFDGYVTRMDCKTLELEATVAVGPNPEGMAVADGKLYVAISGGLNYTLGIPYDNRVAVVDLASFSLQSHLTTDTNPTKVGVYAGSVYVLCMGDYGKEASHICKITGTVSTYLADANHMAVGSEGVYAINAPYGSPDPITYLRYEADGTATPFVKEGVIYPEALAVDSRGCVMITSCQVEYGNPSYSVPGYYNYYSSEGDLIYTGATGIDPYAVTFAIDEE